MSNNNTIREIELEKQNERLKSLNKHLTENGLFSQRHFKKENERLSKKLKIAEEALQYYADGEDIRQERTDTGNVRYVIEDSYTDTAQQALQKMKEVKDEY